MTDDWKIVGTSESLEKRYLRITSMPDPTTVRPEHVLRRALAWLRDKNEKGEEYEYISEQFRSMRQDLTIQHIKNAFTAEVYEENSKVSLRNADLGQYNQCQATLWDLYRSGVYFTVESRSKFLSYQLLSLIIEQKNQQLEKMLVQLTGEVLESEQIQRVLRYDVGDRRMRRMLKLGNYPQFFQFYYSSDELTRLYLDQYIDKIRAMAVAMIAKTYAPPHSASARRYAWTGWRLCWATTWTASRSWSPTSAASSWTANSCSSSATRASRPASTSWRGRRTCICLIGDTPIQL